MALWQIDIVGGVFLVDGTECKVVTGVDDHSRFCVMATVVVRATGRAVCLAFADALRRYGVALAEILIRAGERCRVGLSDLGGYRLSRYCCTGRRWLRQHDRPCCCDWPISV
jgi:hypothetical protein